ncbi:MAG TPA: LPS export ABC transporter periplasmic protein LptC, partial [Xanthobacteraceae bacterium]
TMEAPRLAGFTRDARGYEVTARAASQDITKPDVLELRDIRAKVEMQDKAVVELTAASGLYETKSERVTLNKDIVLTSSAGYEGRLSEAVVDVKSGNIVSQNPVEVKLLNGTLNANRLEVSERGDVIRFDGGVVMNLTLGASGREKAP